MSSSVELTQQACVSSRPVQTSHIPGCQKMVFSTEPWAEDVEGGIAYVSSGSVAMSGIDSQENSLATVGSANLRLS
jgi:hypothetical protein